MDLMKRCRILLLAGCLALGGAVPALADYTSWQDPRYEFSKVRTVYMAQMDMSGYGLQNLAKKQKMVDHFNTRAAKAKLKTAKLVLEPVSQPRALLPGEKPAVPEKEMEPARQQAPEKQFLCHTGEHNRGKDFSHTGRLQRHPLRGIFQKIRQQEEQQKKGPAPQSHKNGFPIHLKPLFRR